MSIILKYSIFVSYLFLSMAMVLSFFRLIKGATVIDRILALDIIGLIAVGFICVHCIHSQQTYYLLCGFVVGLLGFLGIVAFAKYVHQRGLS